MPDPMLPADFARIQEPRLARGMRIVADEHINLAGGVAAFSGAGSWSNQAVALGIDAEVTEDDVARLIDFYASRGVEPKVELAPHAHESALRRLKEAGFVPNGFEQVLYRRLEAGGEPLPEPDPAVEMEIVDVGSPAVLEEMIKQHHRAAAGDEAAEPSEQLRRVMGRAMSHHSVRVIVARLDGELAGICMLELDPPISQLFAGSTRVALRRRGVQRAMLLERLRMAQEAGCRFSGVETAPGGPTERNAMRLGFMPMYTRVSLVRPGEGLTPSP